MVAEAQSFRRSMTALPQLLCQKAFWHQAISAFCVHFAEHFASQNVQQNAPIDLGSMVPKAGSCKPRMIVRGPWRLCSNRVASAFCLQNTKRSKMVAHMFYQTKFSHKRDFCSFKKNRLFILY